MMGVRFVAVVIQTRRSDYSVHFPDLPGCVTAGKTRVEVRQRATEALSLHLDGMKKGGVPIPIARSLTEIRNDPNACRDATTLMLIEVRRPPG